MTEQSAKNVLLKNRDNVPLIPYVNPASTTEAGLVKIDGTTITINNGVISAAASNNIDQAYDPSSSNAQSGVAIANAGFLTSHQSLSGVVPTSRTINSIPLTSDITLTPSDIGAASSSHTHSELDNKTIISLSGSGTVSLSLNRIHKVTQTGDITFSLPNGSSTDFCQMQVMIEANGSSVTLGTANYFNGKVPSFSANTCYSLIYEYDVINSGWTVGFMSHS